MTLYCTLFDMNYFPKWYVMYRSWLKYSQKEDKMVVLPLDYDTANFLNKNGPWEKVEILGPDTYDALKTTRTYPEWCWTHTPVLMDRMLETRNCDVTYLDADLYFMSDISPAWAELQNKSVGVVLHNFTPEHAERLRPSGLFNVSWVTFRNDPAAKAISKRWLKQVLEKCNAETCGDQKYLDEWPAILGSELKAFDNPGIGVAPWNAARYEFKKDSTTGQILIRDKQYCGHNYDPILFYHFHELKRKPDGTWYLTGYDLPSTCIQEVYAPYLRELEAAYNLMEVMKEA